MKKYIRIARPDHWIKQLFIFPGCLFALLLANSENIYQNGIWKVLLGFIATCFIASANYVINEWLDAEFDKFHPTKKYRAVVLEDVKGSIVYVEYALLTALGLAVAYTCCKPVFFCELWLWVMGYGNTVQCETFSDKRCGYFGCFI